MADDSMPPRPECEFDFNLPHGIDTTESVPYTQERNATRSGEDPNSQTGRTDEELDALFEDGIDNAQQPMNYDTFAQGFSDDEGGDEAFDRSWTAHQAKRPSPKKKKKSPRRSEDGDGDDEASPRTKRPRKSIFGGPLEELEAQEREKYVVGQDNGSNAPPTPGQGIRHCMSGLNIDEQDAQDDRPFNIGFGLSSSERDSMSPVASRDPSEDSVIIPPDDHPAYKLRENIDRAKAYTYIDTDKTGNYDPDHESRLKALRLQKAKAAKAAKKKENEQKAAKKPVLKYIVKLRFTAYGNVRNIINDEDNWPKDWSVVDSDSAREMEDIREFHRRNTPCVPAQTSIEDPLGATDDLTGYPAARGCYDCRKENKDCSMVAGGTYPCDECEDDEIDCELILAPIMKGRCKQCDEDEQEKCSLEEHPHQAICEYCVEHELACEASPPRGYRTPRSSYDDVLYGPNRKHVQCTFCRIEKKRCSLKKKTDKPPCKYCKKHGIGCTFYDAPPAPVNRKSAGKQKAPIGPTEGAAPEVSRPGSEFFSLEDLDDMDNDESRVMSREATPEIEMEDNFGNKGVLTKIKTSFAHPIKFSGLFNTTPDCNFCELPCYGFTGLFEVEVHVLRWYSGLGYTELGGGHRESIGETTMCAKCTIGRAQIVSCEQHDIRPVYDDDTAPDFDDVFADLLIAEEGSALMHHELQRWCSMCFSPATFICCARQFSLFSSADEEVEIEGCGLRLCASCEVILRELFAGDSSAMAAAMDMEPKAEVGQEEVVGRQVRADVGFLSREGLLMKALEYDMEQGAA